jgi:protease I
MSDKLKNKRVALLATDGVEQAELIEPKKALEEAGAQTDVISPKDGKIKGWNHTDLGKEIPVDVNLKSADQNNLRCFGASGRSNEPGSPAHGTHRGSVREIIRRERKTCRRNLSQPLAARGRRVTSWPSLRTDIRNAGGEWSDQEVVTDRGLVTSRKPADIPAFNRKMIEEFAEGKHAAQQTYASAR